MCVGIYIVQRVSKFYASYQHFKNCKPVGLKPSIHNAESMNNRSSFFAIVLIVKEIVLIMASLWWNVYGELSKEGSWINWEEFYGSSIIVDVGLKGINFKLMVFKF